MSPNYYSGQLIMYSKVSAYSRGDVIIAKAGSADITVIKRVIGVPGDQIEIRNGVTIRNGVRLREDYILRDDTDTMDALTVPDGFIFVMGDNRSGSMDSRAKEVGLIRESAVIGTVLRSRKT